MAVKVWADVVDTAVKIGLGGLITGFFTYLGLTLSHRAERKKLSMEHRIKLIEQIAKDIEEHFSCWNAFTSQITGIARNRVNHTKEYQPLTLMQKQTINERNAILVESWAKRSSAIANLRLLKANDAAEILFQTKSLQKQLRDRIVFDDDFPTYQELIDHVDKVNDSQKQVHEKLSDFYHSL